MQSSPISYRLLTQWYKTGDFDALIKRCWHHADKALTLGDESSECVYLFNFGGETFLFIDLSLPVRPSVRYFGSFDAMNEFLESDMPVGTFH